MSLHGVTKYLATDVFLVALLKSIDYTYVGLFLALCSVHWHFSIMPVPYSFIVRACKWILKLNEVRSIASFFLLKIIFDFSSVFVKNVIRILIVHWINRTLGGLDILTVLFLLIWKHGESFFPFIYSSSFFHQSFDVFSVVPFLLLAILNRILL